MKEDDLTCAAVKAAFKPKADIIKAAADWVVSICLIAAEHGRHSQIIVSNEFYVFGGHVQFTEDQICLVMNELIQRGFKISGPTGVSASWSVYGWA